ncbi:hypothetical protein [Vibrio parahaemolyticus]|uniref:hypothetical protein n=1 Tax=Vibrio parahaemolyticus TaxID=670 RepID=UPI00111E9382|nr:hypothetical protein [Vibrio parahaemolyticus]ELA8131901.1 hypothetical protein [Vibrio parahaemolyticus]MBE3953529.1 hypothetical protein [Vibrio parahaemolyticus]TOK50799.1 hypothetical protein CGI17_24405 [Vibrio parahaemolyticus]TOK78211.1 hypothetical protein CGI11_20760 [Vibrio parahaemolyticus]TOK83711.1 hypothetical protein CGI10_19730 [Vibrio parahaemolyticus]
MSDLKNLGQDIKDQAIDTIDKMSTPTTRSGSVLNRVAGLREHNIPNNVIALLMTETSPTKKSYTEEDVDSYDKLYNDCRSGVPLTAEATRGLMRDAENRKKEPTSNVNTVSTVLPEEVFN